MSSMKKLERPLLHPGYTVWRSTSGPVVYVGDLIPGNDKHAGWAVQMNERESRELLHAWGWPTPEAYAELEQRHAEASAAIDELEARVAELEDSQIKVVPASEVLAAITARSER